jgi:hypothetical protein
MRKMVGVFAELERGMISARTRAGRRLKAEQGGYVGGRPPYGFRAENGSLVPDDREQEAIGVAQSLRRSGHSLREIARHLEEAGFKRKGGRTRWHPVQVARSLEQVGNGVCRGPRESVTL